MKCLTCPGQRLWVVVLSAWTTLCPSTQARVQIDQRIHLTFGWEPQEDVLTTMVKRESSHLDRDSHRDVDIDSRIGAKVKRDVLNNEKTRNLENSGHSEWEVVEELRGDEIKSGLRVKGAGKGQGNVLTSELEKIPWYQQYKTMKANRRHKRDEIVQENNAKDMEDCVMDGKSVRMNKGKTMEDRREEEIEEEEEGGGGGVKKRGADGGSGRHGGSGRDGGHHVIVMVEMGSEARMACHKCTVRSRGRGSRSQPPKETRLEGGEGRTSLLWYRLSREKERGHFKIQEVSLDMHDDTSRDRVYVTRDHALIFSKTKSRDGGSYFCKTPDEDNDVITKESVPEEDMAQLFKNPKVHYFYHLDVIKPSQEDAIIVSPPGQDNGSYPAPSPQVNVTDMNVRVFTQWQEWSPCSLCDQPGTRRRVGQCVVTPLDHNQTVSPVFLDAVLSAYEGGVPCRSSLLHGHESLRRHISRPEEVIQGDCNVTCRLHHAQLVMSAYGFLGSAAGTSERHVLEQKKFRESEGDHVTLRCQRTSVAKAVAWINGSTVLIPTHLKKSTRGRVWVDEHNSLHINPVLPQDASSYVCLVQGQVKGFVRLKVKAKPPDCVVCRYATYLAYTYPVNFVIYLVVVYAKHQEKKRTLNYDLLPAGSSSSGSSMEGNGDAGEG